VVKCGVVKGIAERDIEMRSEDSTFELDLDQCDEYPNILVTTVDLYYKC
jgi:hypothetical protein